MKIKLPDWGYGELETTVPNDLSIADFFDHMVLESHDTAERPSITGEQFMDLLHQYGYAVVRQDDGG